MKKLLSLVILVSLIAMPAVHADFWDFFDFGGDSTVIFPGGPDSTIIFPDGPDSTIIFPDGPDNTIIFPDGPDGTIIFPDTPIPLFPDAPLPDPGTAPIFDPAPFDPISFPGDFPMDPNNFNPTPGSPVPFPPNLPVPANAPPVLNNIGSRTVLEGQLLTFTVSGFDPENQQVAFAANNLPPGASFASQTFSWTPDLTQQGNYIVHFTITDNAGQQDSESVQISVLDVGTPPPPPPPPRVNHAPVFLSQPELTSFIREWYFSQVIVFDADGDNLALSLATAPAGMTLDYTDNGYTVFARFIDEADSETDTAITGDTFTATVHDITQTACDVTINDRRMTFVEDVNYLIAINGIQYAVMVEPDLSFGDCYVEIVDHRVTTGWLMWLPEPTQIGINPVTIHANDGQTTTPQAFTITVIVDPRTLPREDEPRAPRKNVRVNTIALPEEAFAGDVVLATINFENSGDLKLDGAEATLSIPELGIRSPTIGPLDLRVNKDVSRTLVLEIPADAADGLYTVRLTIDSGSVHRIVHRDIEIISD